MIQEDHVLNAPIYRMPTCDSEDAHYFSVNGAVIDEGSQTVENVARLLQKSHPSVHVYVKTNVNEFLNWYYGNIRSIAMVAGVMGGFSYGYTYLGREVVLTLNGEYPYIPEEPEEPEYVSGDVDGDEDVTNADVLMIYRYIYDPAAYPLDVDVADVDGDGYVTNADVLMIYRYIYDPVAYPLG